MIGGTSALEITRPTRKPHAIPIASAITNARKVLDLTDQLIGTVAGLAGTAVQQGVREAGNVAGGHPGLGVHNDGGIQAHIEIGRASCRERV